MEVMDSQKEATKNAKNRKNERGAALVTVMMVSFLMLVAVAGLLLEASMTTGNVTDATSEEQAYYAAESGVQSVVDALRHHPQPSPLIDALKTPYPPLPDAHEANEIDYLKAVTRATSNKCVKTDLTTCVDTASGSYADPLDRAPNAVRLSRWLPYNWGPDGGADAASKDRIVLGDPRAYSPINGFAYSVEVSDPDFGDGMVNYTVSGDLDLAASGSQNVKEFLGLTASDKTTITYNPPVTQTINVDSGFGTGRMGSFTITKSGAGGTIPTGNGLWRFKLLMTKTGGINTTVVFRGYILPANMTLETESANCSMNDISFLFDSQFYAAFGSRLEMVNPDPLPAGSPAVCAVEERKDNSSDTGAGPDGVFLAGWRQLAASVGQPLNVRLKMSKPHPTRLLIKSTGYGPKGAKKQLESIIQKNYFEGLGAPSPLTMIGPACTPSVACADIGTTATNTTSLFNPGNSRPVFYTGKDRNLRYFLPPIGATNETNTSGIRTATNPSTFNGAVFGTVENILDELPDWLRTPANLHEKVLALRDVAESSGSYWVGNQSGVPVGNYVSGTGVTFIDGDLDIAPNQPGGGVLVVNGRITNNGGYSFKGLILIIGRGGMERNGGGSATLEGNMIIAPYMSSGRRIGTALTGTLEPSLACSGNPLTTPQTTAFTNSCFYAPRYAISGGGGSDVMYNSQNVMNGLSGLGNFVKGVAEK